MEINKTSLDNYITGNYGEDEQRLQEKRYGTKVKTMLFDLEEVREAVDITIGDDGFRSKEVIEILKQMREENNNATTKSNKQTKSRNDNKRPVKVNR